MLIQIEDCSGLAQKIFEYYRAGGSVGPTIGDGIVGVSERKPRELMV